MQFNLTGLHFTDWKLGVIGIVSSVFSYLGIATYRYCLFKTSWRNIYIFTTLLILVFSILQLCLIFRLNQRIGVSDVVFSLGDNAMAHFVGAVQFLPAVSMFLRLCPNGAEGTVSMKT